MRQRLAFRTLLLATLVLSATGVALAAYAAFPLAITFAPLTDSSRGITGGDPYLDRSEGRVPSVTMTRDGVIVLDTRGSTRGVCFGFDGGGSLIEPSLAPHSGCYPVLMRTLIRTDNVHPADLEPGETLDFGMDTYFTGVAQDGRTYDFVVEFKRVDGNGIDITYTTAANGNPDTWTANGTHPAKVSAYRKGKGAGWTVVGQYDMPVHFTATRAN
jgi:hypothetical protein